MSKEVKKRFVTLAGGPGSHVVLIPTGMSDEDLVKRGLVRGQGKGWAQCWGINHVTMLHTREKEQSNSEYFSSALRNSSGVWTMGGRQWRLADAYLDTAVEREIKALLARGGVVGGSSAGASIQASFLIRAEPGKDGKSDGDFNIVISPGHTQGFALLTHSAIDQHLNTRKRESALLDVVKHYPDLLGFGIDEKAAMIVHGSSLEVLEGRIGIYDGRFRDSAFCDFLTAGSKFNTARRAACS